MEDAELGLPTGIDATEPDETVEPPKGLTPERYKDVFTASAKINGAWNHLDPFQMKQWREAVRNEF